MPSLEKGERMKKKGKKKKKKITYGLLFKTFLDQTLFCTLCHLSALKWRLA